VGVGAGRHRRRHNGNGVGLAASRETVAPRGPVMQVTRRWLRRRQDGFAGCRGAARSNWRH